MMITDSGLLFWATLYSHMSYVSTEIHTRQCYCTVFITFRWHCHYTAKNSYYCVTFVLEVQLKAKQPSGYSP